MIETINGFTHRVLMVRPFQFHKNEETATNNYYQKEAQYQSKSALTRAAQKEFDALVDKLRAVGIEVIVHQDTPEFETPDSLFPNNWISFHPNFRVILYPMFAVNRRKERNPVVFQTLEKNGISIRVLKDYSAYENTTVFLEGTGSMVLDRANKIAYAALSERTNRKLFQQFCLEQAYQGIVFTSYQTVEGMRLPIYHTNVMMSIGPTFATVGLDTIDSKDERKQLYDALMRTQKELVLLSESQINQFAGNMLTLIGEQGPVLVMSSAAFSSLTQAQKKQLKQHAQLIHSPLDTIEHCGGGSARCMLAEIF